MRKGFVMLLLLAIACFYGACSAMAEGVSRALIVTCDTFLTRPDTLPSAGNSGIAMEKVFQAAGFERVTRYADQIASIDTFYAAIENTFGGASDMDKAFLYLCSHGVTGDETALLLSDGVNETALTASMLEQALRNVCGPKVIIIDACHSGAFIQKGTSQLNADHPFIGKDYKVLTSAGGDEDSWFWHTSDHVGSGYFSDILTLGLGAEGFFAADLDRDGNITLSECYRYLLDAHGASTPRVYPQNDDFTLITYDPQSLRSQTGQALNLIDAIMIDSSVLDMADKSIDVEFTALTPAKVAYRIVYFRENGWAFNPSRLIYDTFEAGGDYGDEKGAIAPGRKSRQLDLLPYSDASYGYALFQLMTLEGGDPAIRFSRVLAVPRMGGDPHLSIRTMDRFTPAMGQEMPIHILHDTPIAYSAVVLDQSDEVVARLATRSASRPEQLLLSGTTLYWDGLLKDGQPAPDGAYRIRVTAHFPEESYTAESDLFILISPNG